MSRFAIWDNIGTVRDPIADYIPSGPSATRRAQAMAALDCPALVA